MNDAAVRADRKGTPYPPARPKGRVLFIGASFYNNWYLSRELRRLGWVADTFTCSAEGAEPYLHGTDYFHDESQVAWSGAPGHLIDSLREVADAYLAGLERGDTPERRGRLGLGSRRLAWRTGSIQLRNETLEPEGEQSLRSLVQALQVERNRGALGALFRALMRLVCPDPVETLRPIVEVIDRYDILHFTGFNSMRLLYFVDPALFGSLPLGWDIDVLKRLGKRIVYTSIGCHDGVTQSRFRQWGESPICDICRWRDEPNVCSDERNRRWGMLRNHLSDYVILLGGNHADFNDEPHVHEVPEFYCIDPDLWHPDVEVPAEHRVDAPPTILRIYHAVGDYDARTKAVSRENIKTTHLIVPAVERLKARGYPVELVFCTDLPNKIVRYYQAQSDIVVDMLTYGFYGANVREALMLGKPVVCYLRPEWLESMRREIPDYVDEIPVVSATPETIDDVLIDLVTNEAKRRDIGRRSRAFALKWHSSAAAGERFDRLYSELLRAPARVRAGVPVAR